MGLGRLRIDVIYEGNKIQIFNSLKVCSLVINDRVADTFIGLYAGEFQLRGKIQTNDGEKEILAEMSLFTAVMHVFCDGTLVAKKWMPFG